MKRLIIYAFLLLSIGFSNIYGNDKHVNANNFYTEGKYQEAIISYEEILNSGLEHGTVYYNLANSYYKLGNLPKAILNYERALLLNPQDKDAKYNLQICNSQITDKLESVGEFFLITWYNSFKSMTNSDTWAYLSLFCFALTILLVILFIYSSNSSKKQLYFYLGLVILLISISTNIFSYQQKQALTKRNHGIIFSPSVTVKSSPSQGGNELFILHEGTKVKVLETISNWSRIQISDGNVGWAPSSTLEII